MLFNTVGHYLTQCQRITRVVYRIREPRVNKNYLPRAITALRKGCLVVYQKCEFDLRPGPRLGQAINSCGRSGILPSVIHAETTLPFSSIYECFSPYILFFIYLILSIAVIRFQLLLVIHNFNLLAANSCSLRQRRGNLPGLVRFHFLQIFWHSFFIKLSILQSLLFLLNKICHAKLL